MPPKTKKRAWQAAQKCRLPGSMSSPPYLRRYHGGLTVSWNEISPPCIMLRQTSDPCPGLAIRFPVPYTSLMDVPYYRGGIPGQPRLKNGGGSISLFSFLHPNFRTAVPALDKIIGIPALRRDDELCLNSRGCIHQPPPAFGAENCFSLFS